MPLLQSKPQAPVTINVLRRRSVVIFASMLGKAEMRGRAANVSGERHAEAADGLISACEGDRRDGGALNSDLEKVADAGI